MDFQSFYSGQCFDAYTYLGAHTELKGVTFRTFAPDAAGITILGDFSNWVEWEMHRTHDGNFWECWIENAKAGDMYKYRIYKKDGSYTDHCDPYGFGMELRPGFASIVRNLNDYHFADDSWMQKRTIKKDEALNIYELHFGSFRKPGPNKEDWYTYKEMCNILIPYLKENGYNYVELMPLSEHPCDESWGYQNTGFYSPTSRYGTAEDLKIFVEACHKENIGLIMDFVPVHFAIDDYALGKYDGTSLYEYPHSDVGQSEWGSYNFMHSRGEVRSFLQSAANYWLSEFHFDGIRMDAISRIIYWQGDPARGVNGNAVSFIQTMNQGLKSLHPTALLSAEDSTSFPNVTKPVHEGGLGFDYKWDMGWMNDTLNYFRTAPEYRSDNYHKLTFSMMYYYNENYLLPLSHDETVHGKATILQKMHGDYSEKFPQGRAFYMYMYAHPGKKLNFMGNEIGQLREWDEKREQDWDILKYPLHDAFHTFMKDLNKIYLEHPSLYEMDYVQSGFHWLDCHQEERCIYAFERTSKQERIIAVFNFSDHQQKGYELDAKDISTLIPLLDSETDIYGGTKQKNSLSLKPKHGKIILDLEAYSARFYLVKA